MKKDTGSFNGYKARGRLLHTPEGVRDVYGSELAGKEHIKELISRRIHSFGYRDIQTPTFEYFDIFSSDIGTTPSRELYKFFDRDGDTLVLRPDFTPSVVRSAAKYFGEGGKPLRLCYSGQTFANTSSLRGKLKENTQIGAEFMGDDSPEADAEIIALACLCLADCGLKKYQLTVGNVEFFRGICLEAGMDGNTEQELRDLISVKNYFAAEELLKSRGIDVSVAEKLLKCSELFGGIEVLEEAGRICDNRRSEAALERLKKIYGIIKMYGAGDYVGFDMGLLSKYHYYSGIVFKAYSYGAGDAIATGGRYDYLHGLFGGERPATGFCILVDDLMNALRRQGVETAEETEPEIIYYNDTDFESKLALAMERRSQGAYVEMIKK